MAKMRRISDFAPLSEVRPPSHKPEEFDGQDLIIHEVEFVEGPVGPFASMIATLASDTSQTKITVTCGGRIVLKQLKAMTPENFPVAVRFNKTGRSWFLE